VLAIVLGALALLEPLEHAVLARGIAELVSAPGDVGLAPGQLVHSVQAPCFDPFHERLARLELLGAEDGELACGVALFGAGVLEMNVHRLQTVLATRQTQRRLGKLAAGKILTTFTERTYALEAERE